VNRLEKYALNAEATFVRLGSLHPEYLPKIEAFLELVSELKDHLWEFQVWVEQDVIPRDRKDPWNAVRSSARALLESVNILCTHISAPPPKSYLTALNLSNVPAGNELSSGKML